MILSFSNCYTCKWNKSDKFSVYIKPRESGAGTGMGKLFSDSRLLKKNMSPVIKPDQTNNSSYSSSNSILSQQYPYQKSANVYW